MGSVSARAALRGIEKRYGAIRALRGVNLNLDRGEIHALVGQNGSGKSTLIKVLSGAAWPDAGAIVVDSEPHRFRSPAAAVRAGVNVVHQDVHVFPDLSVAENITLANAPRRRVGPIAVRDRRAARRRAQRVLTRRSGPTARRRRSCSRRTRRR